MIRVRVDRDRDGDILGTTVHGHAEYAEHGSDIVCAAVSVLAQATLNGLIEVVRADVDYRIDDAGALSFRVNNEEHKKETVKALLETFALGVRATAEAYTEYVELVEKEV